MEEVIHAGIVARTKSKSGNFSYLRRNLRIMLVWSLMFAVLALIFGLLGFRGAASGFGMIARILLVLFLILFVLSLLFGNRVFHA